MLAQSFKTAKELNLPEDAVAALQKTLVLLETDEVQHILEKDFYNAERDSLSPRKFSKLFNMSSWSTHRKCGTVACIGGTARLISGIDFYVLAHEEKSLRTELFRLFYPNMKATISYDNITVAQGAHALRNYLTYGQSKWAEVLRG